MNNIVYPIDISQLKKTLKETNKDIDKISTLLAIADCLYNNAPADSRKYATDALNLAITHERDYQIAKARAYIAKCFLKEGIYSKAITYILPALAFFSKTNDVKNMAPIYLNYGLALSEQGKFIKAWSIYRKALIILKKLNDKKGLASFYQRVGNIYNSKDNYTKAWEQYFKALSIYQELNNQVGIAHCNNNIGNIYLELGNHEKALEQYISADNLYVEINDLLGRLIILNNIGTIYEIQCNFTKSLSYYNKALSISEQMGNQWFIIRLNAKIGGLYLALNQTEKALESLSISSKRNEQYGGNNNENFIVICRNIGNVYIKQEQFEKAISYFIKASTVADKLGNKHLLCDILIETAKALITQEKQTGKKTSYKKIGIKKYKSIRGILNKARCLAEEMANVRNRRDVYQILVDYHKYKGNYKQAFLFLELYMQVKDTLLNEEKVAILAKFEAEKKEKEIIRQQELLIQQEQTNKLLVQLNKKIKQRNEELQSFASLASHDMKEPIRMINSFAELLKRRYKDNLDEAGMEYLHFMQDAAQRMYIMLKDLIDYARADIEDTPTQKVALNDVLSVVKNNLRLKIQESQTQLTYENLPIVEAHFTPITQVFQNLVANSIKFQQKDTNPIIHIDVHQETENTYIFRVKDNGIGIIEENISKIFIAFKRLHARDEYEGSGIGLATCKKIIEKYACKIWVDSVPKQGTCFYFSLPKEGCK